MGPDGAIVRFLKEGVAQEQGRLRGRQPKREPEPGAKKRGRFLARVLQPIPNVFR